MPIYRIIPEGALVYDEFPTFDAAKEYVDNQIANGCPPNYTIEEIKTFKINSVTISTEWEETNYV